MPQKIKKEYICIRCPRGCEISIILNGSSIDKIKGNECKLGIDYIKREIIDPRRIITTTVRVKNGLHPLVPVWTTSAIPKDKIFDLMKKLQKVELEAPVKINTKVLENIFDTGIDVVTSGKVD